MVVPTRKMKQTYKRLELRQGGDRVMIRVQPVFRNRGPLGYILEFDFRINAGDTFDLFISPQPFHSGRIWTVLKQC
jgi:hypothetical protein